MGGGCLVVLHQRVFDAFFVERTFDSKAPCGLEVSSVNQVKLHEGEDKRLVVN